MPPTTPIPRFLLPQRSAIWRMRLSTSAPPSLTVRNASHKAPKKSSKPLVLEKPSKFRPPSHPSRLRKETPRYPGPQLSEEQLAAQKSRKYPNMMPPEGTFMHWFMNNKTIHMFISLVRFVVPPITYIKQVLIGLKGHIVHTSRNSLDHKLQA